MTPFVHRCPPSHPQASTAAGGVMTVIDAAEPVPAAWVLGSDGLVWRYRTDQTDGTVNHGKLRRHHHRHRCGRGHARAPPGAVRQTDPAARARWLAAA